MQTHRALCPRCSQEMQDGTGCTGRAYLSKDEREILRIPYGSEGARMDYVSDVADMPCCRCGTPPGSFHHTGCDWEQCGECGEQVFACGCVPEAAAGTRRYLQRMRLGHMIEHELPHGVHGHRYAVN